MSNQGAQDPNWSRYFRWPITHFPIQFPACRVTLSRGAADGASGAVVRVRQAASVPLLIRLVDAGGLVLHESYPRIPEGSSDVWEETFTVEDEPIRGGLGICFTWGFYVPMMPYVPGHPLGVVMAPHDFVAGQRLMLDVTADRRPT